jgi:hypothetical protein
MFFLLATLIILYAVSHYYLQSKYPTSVDFIQRNLGSATIAEQSKIEEAKKEGYSEKEIAEYLAKRNSARFREYTKNIFLIEAVVFVASFFIGLGLIIMNPNAKKNDAMLGLPIGASQMKKRNLFLKYYLLSVSAVAAIGFACIIGGVNHRAGWGEDAIPTWRLDPLLIGVGAGLMVFAYLIYREATRKNKSP